MKIYDSKNIVYDAVDAVVEFGIAVIEGTKGPAVDYSERVIRCLEPHNDIQPIIGYQNVPERGYLYYVYDSNRFLSMDKELKELVFEIANKSPINT